MPPDTAHSTFIATTETNHIEKLKKSTEQLDHVERPGNVQMHRLGPPEVDRHCSQQPNKAGEQVRKCHKKWRKFEKFGKSLSSRCKNTATAIRCMFRKSHHKTRVSPRCDSTGNLHQSSNLCTEPLKNKYFTHSLENMTEATSQWERTSQHSLPNKETGCTTTSESVQSRPATETHTEQYRTTSKNTLAFQRMRQLDSSEDLSSTFSTEPQGGNHLSINGVATNEEVGCHEFPPNPVSHQYSAFRAAEFSPENHIEIVDTQKMHVIANAKLPVVQNNFGDFTCLACTSESTQIGDAEAPVEHTCQGVKEKICDWNALGWKKRLNLLLCEKGFEIVNSSERRVIDNNVLYGYQNCLKHVRPHSEIHLQTPEFENFAPDSPIPRSMTDVMDISSTGLCTKEARSMFKRSNSAPHHSSNRVVEHQRAVVKPTESFRNDYPTTNQLEEISQDEFSSTPHNTKLHCSSQNATVTLETEAAVLGIGQDSTSHLGEMVGSNFNGGNCVEKVVKEEGGKDMGAIFDENAVNCSNNKSNATDFEDSIGSGQKVDSCMEHQGTQQSKADLISAKEFDGDFTCNIHEERDLEVEKKEAEFQSDACDVEGYGEITDNGIIQGEGDLDDSTDQDSQKNPTTSKKNQQANFLAEALLSNNTYNEDTLPRCGNTGNEQLDGSSMEISKPEGPDIENMQGAQSSSDKDGFEDDRIACDNQETKRMSTQMNECGFRHHTGGGNQPTGSNPSGNSKSEGGSSDYSGGAQAAGGGGEATGGCSGSSGGDGGDRGNEKRRKIDGPTDKEDEKAEEDEKDEFQNETEEDPIGQPENQISLDRNSTGEIPIVKTSDLDELMDEKKETEEDETTNQKANDGDTQPAASKDADATGKNKTPDATTVGRLLNASMYGHADMADNQKPEDEEFQQDQTNPVVDAIGRPQTSSKGGRIKGRTGDLGEREDWTENDPTEYKEQQPSDQTSSNAATIGRSLDASKYDHDRGKGDELVEQKNAEVADNIELGGKDSELVSQTSPDETVTGRSSAVSVNNGTRCINCVPGDQGNEAVSEYQDSVLTEIKSENRQDSTTQSYQYIGASTATSKRPSHQLGTPSTSAVSLSSGGRPKYETNSCVPVTEPRQTLLPEDGRIKRSKQLSISARKFQTKLQIEIPSLDTEPSNRKEMKSLNVAYSRLSPTSDCKRTADDNSNATASPVHIKDEEQQLRKNDFPTLNDDQFDWSTLPKIILEETGPSAGQHNLLLEIHSMQESMLQPGARRDASSPGNSENLSPMAQAAGPQSPLNFSEILLDQKTAPFYDKPRQAMSVKALDNPGVSVEDENAINDTKLVSNADIQQDPEDPLAILRPSKDMLAGNTVKGKTAGKKPDQDTEAVSLGAWGGDRLGLQRVLNEADNEDDPADPLAALRPSSDMHSASTIQAKIAEMDSARHIQAALPRYCGAVFNTETTLDSASDGNAVVCETGPFDRGRLPATTKNKRPPRRQPSPPPAENNSIFQQKEETVPHSVFSATSSVVKKGLTLPEYTANLAAQHGTAARNAVSEDQPQPGDIGGSTVKENISSLAGRIKVEQSPSVEETVKRDDTITTEDAPRSVSESIIPVQEGEAASTTVQDTTQHRAVAGPSVRRKVRCRRQTPHKHSLSVEETDERDDTSTAKDPPRSVTEDDIRVQQWERGPAVVQDTTQRRAVTRPSARRKIREPPNELEPNSTVEGTGAEASLKHEAADKSTVEENIGSPRPNLLQNSAELVPPSDIPPPFSGTQGSHILEDEVELPQKIPDRSNAAFEEAEAIPKHEAYGTPPVEEKIGPPGPNLLQNPAESNSAVGGTGAEAIPKHEAAGKSTVEEKIGPPGPNLLQNPAELVPPSGIPIPVDGARGSNTLHYEAQSPQTIPDQLIPAYHEDQLEKATVDDMQLAEKGNAPIQDVGELPTLQPQQPKITKRQYDQHDPGIPANMEEPGQEPQPLPIIHAGQLKQDAANDMPPVMDEDLEERVLPAPEPQLVLAETAAVNGIQPVEERGAPIPDVLEQLGPEALPPEILVPHEDQPEPVILMDLPIRDKIEAPELQPLQPQENKNLVDIAAPAPVVVASNPIQDQINGQPADEENDDLVEMGDAVPHLIHQQDHLPPQQNELADHEAMLEGCAEERECGLCKGQERLGHIHGQTLQFLCPFCYERTLDDENERAFSTETDSLKLHKRVCASCGPLLSRNPRPLFQCNSCLKNFCFSPCFLEHRCIPRFFVED